MLELVTTRQFGRDYQRMKKKGCGVGLLEEVVERLRNGQPLHKCCQDCDLIGKYTGFRRCRILPGWILIYTADSERLILTALWRTFPLPGWSAGSGFGWRDWTVGVLKRAYLYITRKRARTVLMFAVLLVMGLFLLTGLSLRAGAKQAAEDVRRTIATGIEIEIAPISGPEIFDLTENEKGETVRIPKIPILKRSQVAQLLAIDGVQGYFTEMGYDPIYTGLDVHPGGYAWSLQAMREDDPEGTYFSEDDWRSTETAMHSNGIYEVADSRWHPFFVNGALELTEGRHVEAGDVGKTIISEELAGRNGLQVGDTIESYNYDFNTGEIYGSAFESEIVGIFRINFEQDLSNWTAEDNILANVMFADPSVRYWSQVESNTHYGRNVLAWEEDPVMWNITLFVEDPLMLESVEEQIKAMEDIDLSFYTMRRYDDEYRAVAKPMNTIAALSTILVVIMSAGTLVILSLILTMWIRSRKREIGILTSIGTKKREILSQFILECCFVAVTAFVLAGVLAGPLTNVVGKQLEGTVNASAGEGGYTAAVDAQLNLTVDRLPSGNMALEYDLLPGTAVLVFLIMLLVCIASVAVSSRQIFRQKPREVLRGG